MIQRLKETQSGIEGQIADLSTSLLDGHPQTARACARSCDGIRRQIRTETQKILSSLENEAQCLADARKAADPAAQHAEGR